MINTEFFFAFKTDTDQHRHFYVVLMNNTDQHRHFLLLLRLTPTKTDIFMLYLGRPLRLTLTNTSLLVNTTEIEIFQQDLFAKALVFGKFYCTRNITIRFSYKSPSLALITQANLV